MTRYIDVDKIKFSGESFNDADGDALVSLSDVRKAIEQTPIADVVEVKHGYWTYVYTGEELLGTDAEFNELCSVCGETSVIASEYCPYCGAKMDEEGGAE